MSAPGDVLPVSLEDSVLDAALSSSMVSLLVTGIYTTVYLGTLYIYITRKGTRSHTVLAAMTLLFLVIIAQIAVEWFLLKRALVTDGGTRASAFITELASPGWNVLFNDICNMLISGLSDGLLIWRCYHAWDCSVRAIFAPLLLLLAEISLYLSVIILAGINHLNPPEHIAQIMNKLLSSALFMTFGSTLLSTVLIAYRIYSVSRHSVEKKHKQPFTGVLEVLIQSAAAYSIVSLLYAVEIAIPLTPSNLNSTFSLQSYTDVFYSFIAGFAPTIMIARVTFASSAPPQISEREHISDLRFHQETSSIP